MAVFGLPAAILVDLASGLLLLGLGAAVARMRPRRAGNVAFGVFSASFGMAWVVGNAARFLPSGGIAQVAAFVAGAALFVLAAAALARMAREFPRPLAREEKRVLPVAAIVAIVYGAFYAAASAMAPELLVYAVAGGEPVAFLPTVAFGLGFGVAMAALWGVLAVLAVRFHGSQDEPLRRQILLASAGLVLYPAFASRPGFYQAGSAGLVVDIGAGLAILSFVVLWLRNSAQTPLARASRRIAWLALGATLAAVAADAWLPAGGSDGAPGIVRVAAVSILAYAIVRHQLLGIDVKVRWGLSKSTIAAAFIAVFFVASEGAQLFFGAGNEWVGLAAAGALVFALAPLQRAAERLAERAVPPETPPAPHADAHERYRILLRRVLRDGAITRDEEMALAHAAAGMGLPAHDAVRLRHETEDEAASGRG